MGNRPRLKKDPRVSVIDQDPLAFTQNKCSDNARMVQTKTESIEFDIWFDKHYYIREQHGDADGKRDGIDANSVKDLVVDAAKHLLYYAIKVRSFSVVNFNAAIRGERVILTHENNNEEDLNIVVEYHYLSLGKYEVTLKTALRTDSFHFSDGQYQVKIRRDGSSTLFKKERGEIKTIDNYL